MLEIVLKVTLVTDTLPAHLLTVALPFSVHKLSAILPQAFAPNRMIQIPFAMFHKVFGITFIKIHNITIGLGDHHEFTFDTLVVGAVL